MELYIHYQQLPQGKELADVVGELNEVLEDNGSVCGGRQGRIDLDLEDEGEPQICADRGEGIPPAGRIFQGNRH